MLRRGLGHPERKAGDTGNTSKRRAGCGRRGKAGSSPNTTGDERGRDPEVRTRLDRTVWVAQGTHAQPREWPRPACIPRKARSRTQDSWCTVRGPGPSTSAAPVSGHTLGTWLGRAVHDPDESLSQEMVVGSLLGRAGHWELDLLEFLRIHAWNAERGRLSVEWPHQAFCSS